MAAAADEPTATPLTDDPAAAAQFAPGSMWAQYNPQGAMGGLFAPAYIRGPGGSTFAPAEKAVSDYNASMHPLTNAMIDELRMPNKPPTGGSGGTIGVNWPYSMGVPAVQNYGDPRGTVDPEALRVLAQGGHYDVEGRRNAIAAQVQQNQAAAASSAPATPAMPAELPGYSIAPIYANERPANPDGSPNPNFKGMGILGNASGPIIGYRYVKDVGQDYNNVGA